jgi:hypothetical protein
MIRNSERLLRWIRRTAQADMAASLTHNFITKALKGSDASCPETTGSLPLTRP